MSHEHQSVLSQMTLLVNRGAIYKLVTLIFTAEHQSLEIEAMACVLKIAIAAFTFIAAAKLCDAATEILRPCQRMPSKR